MKGNRQLAYVFGKFKEKGLLDIKTEAEKMLMLAALNLVECIAKTAAQKPESKRSPGRVTWWLESDAAGVAKTAVRAALSEPWLSGPDPELPMGLSICRRQS